MKNLKILNGFIVSFVLASIICYFITPIFQNPDQRTIPDIENVSVFYMAISMKYTGIPFFCIIILSTALVLIKRNNKIWLITMAATQTFSALFIAFLLYGYYSLINTYSNTYSDFDRANILKPGYGIYLNLVFIIFAIVLSITGLVIKIKNKKVSADTAERAKRKA